MSRVLFVPTFHLPGTRPMVALAAVIGLVLSLIGVTSPAQAADAWSSRGIPLQGQALMGSCTSINASQDPTTRESQLGSTFGVHRTYWGYSQVGSAVNRAKIDVAAGRIPWISFKPQYSWADMKAGKGDAWAKNLAAQLATVDGPVWVAIFHEPESRRKVEDVQDWVAMQKRLSPYFRAYPNIAFTAIIMGWHQFMSPVPDPTISMSALYPGSQYVDLMGFDIYNLYETVNSAGKHITTWTEMKDYYTKIAAWSQSVGGAKWAVAESGYTDLAAQKDRNWVVRAYDDLKAAGGLAYSYWDNQLSTDPTGTYKLDLSIKQSAFAGALARADHWGQDGTQSVISAPAPAPTQTTDVKFRAAESFNGNVQTAAVTLPSSIGVGDAMLMYVSTNTGVAPVGTPTGWTYVGEAKDDDLRTRLYRRVATATDPGGDVTVTFADYTKMDMTVLAYSGVDPDAPVMAWASDIEDATTQMHAAPDLSIPVSGSVVSSFWVDKSSATSDWASPAGMEERSSDVGDSSGRLASLAADTGTSVGTGTYVGTSATANSASYKATMWSVALRPRTGGLAFRAAAALSGNAAAAELTVPAAVASGDALLLFVSTNTGVAPVATPSGWTYVGERTYADLRTRLYSKVASQDAGDVLSLSFPTQSKFDMTLLAYSGTASSSPIAAWSADTEANTTSTHEAPSLTVPTDAATLVRFWVDKSSSTTSWQLPGGIRKRSTATGTGSGRISSVAADATVESTSAASAAAVADAASNRATMWSIALR